MQLSCSIRGLPIKSTVVNIHKREKALGSQRASFSLKESQDLILDLVKEDYLQVTLLLDALDECESSSRSNLFAFLTKLVRTQKSTVKILISSRNEWDIFEHFGRSNNFYINATDNAGDIKRYIKKEIENRLLSGKAKKEIKSEVEDTLNTKAQGM